MNHPTRPRSKRSLLHWTLGAAVALLAVGVGLSLWSSAGVGSEEPAPEGVALPTGPAPPCPVGFVDRPGRDERLRARLRTTEEGAALLRALGSAQTRFCFGDRPVPVVVEGRLLLLDEDASDAELTARVGHLLHHVVRGMPLPAELPTDPDCEALVEQAVEREASAYALELTLRRALGVDQARYEFEPAFWRADEDAREALIADYLRAHPDGAPNLDGLVAGYRRRCETEGAAGR